MFPFSRNVAVSVPLGAPNTPVLNVGAVIPAENDTEGVAAEAAGVTYRAMARRLSNV